MKGAIACAGFLFLMAGCAESAPEAERTLATRILAESVAKSAKPKTVLVISNPFSRESGRPPEVYAFEESGIAGLEKGFGESVALEIDFPSLKPEVLRDPASVQVDPQSATPLSFLVADGAFSEVAQRHPQAEVIVSLIGLPVNLAEFKEWQTPGRPGFALLLPDWRMVGDRQAILQAFRSGKLLAAVVRKRRAPEGDLGGDSREAFDERYFLATPENIEALLSEQPGAFGLK